jgi:hypothetical protein
MKLDELIKRYPKVDKNILKQYKEAEKFIIVNDDPDLHAIKIPLPDPPQYHKIDGFGLPANEQKFKPPKLPDKLRYLQQQELTLDEIWYKIQNNQQYYKDEIKFIKRQWYYRLHGYWCFINGVPTYIQRWQWFYCSWWPIDKGLPKYRSRDRKFYLFAEWCKNDTTAFYPIRALINGHYRYFANDDEFNLYVKDAELKNIKVEKGNFIIDFEKKTCMGFNYPKFRQEGTTYKCGLINYEITSKIKNVKSGVSSKAETHAKAKYLDAIVYPWTKLPFFFRPNWEGSTEPQNGISFNEPSRKISSKGSLVTQKISLDSKITIGISDGSDFDGNNYIFIFKDEVGKFEPPLDLIKIHNVTKSCLIEQGSDEIRGFGINGSTVDKQEKGGYQFRELCRLSDYTVRGQDGRTASGFYNLFIPAWDGILIDEFGNSIIEDPKEPVKTERGYFSKIGGKTLIKNKRSHYILNNDLDGLDEYIRQFPIFFKECWRKRSEESGMPSFIIQQRLEELSFSNPTKRRGNFYWVDGRDSRVEFMDDPLGRWYLSIRLPKNETNLRTWDKYNKTWIPLRPNKFIGGADPHKQDKVKYTNRASKTGGVIFYPHDPILDTSDSFQDWKYSERFVCTYENKSYDKYENAEDLLMMCVYFGCLVNCETDIGTIVDHFISRKYGGYLFHMRDLITGKININPGVKTGNNSIKQDGYTGLCTHYQRHSHIEVHDELMEDALDIVGIDEMRYYDRFTAACHAWVASRNIYVLKEEEEKEKVDLRSFINVYKYN